MVKKNVINRQRNCNYQFTRGSFPKVIHLIEIMKQFQTDYKSNSLIYRWEMIKI